MTVKKWFRSVGGGLDGVVAKRLDLPYQCGERTGMQKLKQRKPRDNEAKLYEDKADSEIAEAIAARNKLDRGGIRKTTEVHPVVWQKNQDDAAFLMERAKRNDFECYVLFLSE